MKNEKPKKTPQMRLGLDKTPSKGRAKKATRLWLRLLTASRTIEDEIGRRFRLEYGISLARFDLMAVLHRHDDGLTMSEVGRHLRVSGGNVTGLVDRLEKEGLVERQQHPSDRRSILVSLTKRGHDIFIAMAQHHKIWVAEILAWLGDHEIDDLYDLLTTVRDSARDAADQSSEMKEAG